MYKEGEVGQGEGEGDEEGREMAAQARHGIAWTSNMPGKLLRQIFPDIGTLAHFAE